MMILSVILRLTITVASDVNRMIRKRQKIKSNSTAEKTFTSAPSIGRQLNVSWFVNGDE